MGCDEEAVAVSVLLEMKQTDRSSFDSKVSASLNSKRPQAPFTTKVSGCAPQKIASQPEPAQQIRSGKRSRQEECPLESPNIRKKLRWRVGDTKLDGSKSYQAASLCSHTSASSNLPAISTAPNPLTPSVPLNSILPCTFDAVVKQSPVLQSPNPLVEKSVAKFLPGVEEARTVEYVPAADISAQLLQQLFSLVNLLSPQELASALLVAELKKLSAQATIQQKAEIGSFLSFLPILLLLLQQQFPSFGKSASATPLKVDTTDNVTMTWIASLLLQACTNAFS